MGALFFIPHGGLWSAYTALKITRPLHGIILSLGDQV